jgi:hypothetical protein
MTSGVSRSRSLPVSARDGEAKASIINAGIIKASLIEAVQAVHSHWMKVGIACKREDVTSTDGGLDECMVGPQKTRKYLPGQDAWRPALALTL